MTQAGAPAEAVQRRDIPGVVGRAVPAPGALAPSVGRKPSYLASLGLVPEKPSHEHGECWRAVGKLSHERGEC